MSAYQDVWRDGRLLHAGERDCEDRYEAIRRAIPGIIEPPFTGMDIGAYSGYFSVRLTEDFDCTMTAIDDSPALKDLPDRITVIRRRIDAGWLYKRARTDLVLALSVLHHMKDWQQVLHEIQACRGAAVVEIPHPDENWFKRAAARDQLPQIHASVEQAPGRHLGDFERTGRNGVTYLRPMYLLAGRVEQYRGQVFTGSGANSRRMRQFGNGLAAKLGYTPFWGSLNIRLARTVDLGRPHVDWVGRSGRKSRDYQFWRAWLGDLPCHAMIPGNRSHGPDCLEIVAPIRLRGELTLSDGDTIDIDIERGEAGADR